MKKLIICLVALLASLSANAQMLDDKSWWYYDTMVFQLTYGGHDLHLAGSGDREMGIVLRVNGEDASYFALDGEHKDMDNHKNMPVSKLGKTMKPEEINGRTVLVFYDEKYNVNAILQPISGPEALERMVTHNLSLMITGMYTNQKGKTVAITKQTFNNRPYKFGTNGESRNRNIIYFTDSEYAPEYDGFIFYMDEYGITFEHGQYYSEDKIWSGASAIPLILKPKQVNGRWPFTSKTFVQPCQLKMLSKKLLRIMRSEIYARHGASFTEPDLASYFKKQSWYKPNNNKSHLTKLELYNIEMIERQEALAE